MRGRVEAQVLAGNASQWSMIPFLDVEQEVSKPVGPTEASQMNHTSQDIENSVQINM